MARLRRPRPSARLGLATKSQSQAISGSGSATRLFVGKHELDRALVQREGLGEPRPVSADRLRRRTGSGSTTASASDRLRLGDLGSAETRLGLKPRAGSMRPRRCERRSTPSGSASTVDIRASVEARLRATSTSRRPSRAARRASCRRWQSGSANAIARSAASSGAGSIGNRATGRLRPPASRRRLFNRNARLAEAGVVVPALRARVAAAGEAEAKKWFLGRRLAARSLKHPPLSGVASRAAATRWLMPPRSRSACHSARRTSRTPPLSTSVRAGTPRE